MHALRVMYEHGFVCETSGCAGLAAVMAGKVKIGGKIHDNNNNNNNKGRIVCVVSGSNITREDLYEELKEEGKEEEKGEGISSDYRINATIGTGMLLLGLGIGYLCFSSSSASHSSSSSEPPTGIRRMALRPNLISNSSPGFRSSMAV